MSEETLFTKIAAGEIPSFTILETDTVLAILDKFPARKGQIVVFPKEYTPSKFSEADPKLVKECIEVAQQVARLQEEQLEGADRSIVAIEGLEVEHFHIKVYPTYPDKEELSWTGHGEEEDDSELEALQRVLQKD